MCASPEAPPRAPTLHDWFARSHHPSHGPEGEEQEPREDVREGAPALPAPHQLTPALHDVKLAFENEANAKAAQKGEGEADERAIATAM